MLEPRSSHEAVVIGDKLYGLRVDFGNGREAWVCSHGSTEKELKWSTA